MNRSYNIFQDWKYNLPKGKLILIMFRIANISTFSTFFHYFLFIYVLFYRVFIEWILGIELSYKTKVGKGLALYHGQALVVNGGSIIGENCIIRHSTTIGNKIKKDGSISSCPKIGNNVEIGAHVCIIGDISIGDNVKIGAGSIVVNNIPSNCIVVGNPARIIKDY